MGGAAAFFGIHNPDMRVTPFGGKIIPSTTQRLLRASIDTHYRLKEQENEFVNRYTGQRSKYATLEPYTSIRTGIAGYWKLDEAIGLPRNDSSGNGNNLTNNNNCAQVAGKIGNATAFAAASSQYLSIGSPPASLAVSTTTLWSFGCWVNPSVLANFKGVWSAQSLGGSARIYLDSTGHIHEDRFSTGGIISTATLSTSAWTFLTMTFDGTTQKLYVNASLDSSRVDISLTSLAAQLVIGASNGPSSFFDGSLDAPFFFSRALSLSEITSLWNGGNGVEIY